MFILFGVIDYRWFLLLLIMLLMFISLGGVFFLIYFSVVLIRHITGLFIEISTFALKLFEFFFKFFLMGLHESFNDHSQDKIQ